MKLTLKAAFRKLKGNFICIKDKKRSEMTHHSAASATEKCPACTAAWICSSENPISLRMRNNSPIVWWRRKLRSHAFCWLKDGGLHTENNTFVKEELYLWSSFKNISLESAYTVELSNKNEQTNSEKNASQKTFFSVQLNFLEKKKQNQNSNYR